MGFSIFSMFQNNFASSPQLSIIIFFLSASFFLYLVIKQKKHTLKPRLPPGPRKLPIIGNLHQLGHLPHRSLHLLAQKHGPIMFLQLGSIPVLVISSPHVAKEIFKTHDVAFSSRPKIYAAEKLTYGYTDITFAPYGEYWREIRKIIVLEVLSIKKVKSFAGVRDEKVQLTIDLISQTLKSGAINLSAITLVLANNVVSRVSFGKKSESAGDDGGEKLHETLLETENIFGGFGIVDFFPWMSWISKFNGLDKRIAKNFEKLDKHYDGILNDHYKSHKPADNEDLVDVLIRVQKDSNQATTLTNEQIKGVITDMFIAGTDTTSATLVWAMAELIRNPLVMRKAQEEIRGLLSDKRMVKESDLSKLVYLKFVINETLRLHPPAPLMVPRETTEFCTINGYDIPPKTRVFFNAQSLATDPEWWVDPGEFRPERFVDNHIDFRGQFYQFLPFRSGRRMCPAVNFALPLLELALANLLYCFNWKLPDGMRREDLDMEESFGITMHKKIPLCLVASPGYA